MRSVLRWTATFVLLVGVAGCGGATPEVKPTTESPKMDEAAKKTAEDQMKMMKGIQEKAQNTNEPTQ